MRVKTIFPVVMFVLIFLLASFLRLYHLGDLPMGLSWDEAAIGYNGYAIFHTRRDEWLVKLPVTFQSFGDYKAAAAIYLDALSTAILGLTPFGIRFPMALAGIATTIGVFFLAYELFQKKSIALLAMFFTAISPWNVHYSRMAFESGIAVAAISWGLFFFLRGLRKGVYLVVSGLFFAVSLYAYHSPKIFLPLLGLVVAARFRKELWVQKRWVVACITVAAVILIPLLRESLFGNAADRIYTTSVLVNKQGLLPFSELSFNVFKNTLAHIDPSFLLFGKTFTYRHGNGKFGVLSPFEAVGLVLMLFYCVRKSCKGYGWMWLVLAAAFVPAIISTGAPHSNRAHLAIPFVQLLASYGISQAVSGKSMKTKMTAVLMFLFGNLAFLAWAVSMYIQVYQGVGAADFQYGYLNAVQTAIQEEKNVEKVVFTTAYGQAYIYILLGKKLSPIDYQHGALANYEIRDIHWDDDKNKKADLLVGSPKEIPPNAPNIIQEIKNHSGDVVFRIVRTGVRE